MKVLVWDTETTGLPVPELPLDHRRQPRICQLAWAILNLEIGDLEGSSSNIVKPDGWTIPDGAAAVHGITTEMAEREGKPIIDVLREFYLASKRVDIHSGHNLRFDRDMMAIEFKKMGKPNPFQFTTFIDTQKETTDLCAIPPTDSMLRAGRKHFKSPKLQEAVEILLGDKEFQEHAHDALNDVMACVRLLKFLHGKGSLRKWT